MHSQRAYQFTTPMKRLIFLCLGIYSYTLTEVNAQQEPQFTQYMYNMFIINPAYAGSNNVLTAVGFYRSQWNDIPGAPKTISFTMEKPLSNEKIGVGFTAYSDQIGPSKELFASLSASYSIQTSQNSELSFGLKAGIHNLAVNFNQANYQHEDLIENFSKFSPTIGLGAFWYSNNWYVGASIPNILQTNYLDPVLKSEASKKPHYYLTAGYIFMLNDNLKFKPAALLKAVTGAPMSFDISANFMFSDKLTLGTAYRLEDSVALLTSFQITEQLNLGYAFDYGIGDISEISKFSHEFMLKYEFNSYRTRSYSPRFF